MNWLSPVKVRTTLIGGEKKMLVWNDLEADEKIKIYDKGVDMNSREGVYELLVNYRSGDMWAPHLEQAEALRHELSYFIECIEDGSNPINDGAAGLRVVRCSKPPRSRCAREARSSISDRRFLQMPSTTNVTWFNGWSVHDNRKREQVNGSFLSIAPDVKLGHGVKLSKFINLYGCEIGDDTKIGAFVEIQKNATIGKRCKISSHTFICEGVTIEDNVFIGHGVTFINDSYPRATTADGNCRPKPTGRSSGRW